MNRSLVQITGPRAEYDSDTQYQEALWKAGFIRAAQDRRAVALRGMIFCLLVVVIGGAVGWAVAAQHLTSHF